MKVSDQNSPIQLDAYVRQAQQHRQANASQTQASAKKESSDTVQLSDQAKQVQQAAQSINNISDVREDKVEEIKMAIEKGTYKVIGDQVATHMLNETIENNGILQRIDAKA